MDRGSSLLHTSLEWSADGGVVIQRGREKAQGRLADLMENSTNDSRGLRNLLEDALSRFDVCGSTSPESSCESSISPALHQLLIVVSIAQEGADEILERIEAKPSNKRAIIRSLSSRQVRECLSLVNETAMNSHQQAVADLESELRVRLPFFVFSQGSDAL